MPPRKNAPHGQRRRVLVQRRRVPATFMSVGFPIIVCMFDSVAIKELGAAVQAMSAADYTSASAQQLAEVLRVVQACIDALASVHARAFGVFDSAGAYEADGCSTGGAWLRRELRLTGGELRPRPSPRCAGDGRARSGSCCRGRGNGPGRACGGVRAGDRDDRCAADATGAGDVAAGPSPACAAGTGGACADALTPTPARSSAPCSTPSPEPPQAATTMPPLAAIATSAMTSDRSPAAASRG